MRVLIIDDDPMSRAGCRKVLERRGFTCTAAQDVSHALECVRRASFDAALLDLKTPAASAMETLKKIRDESPNTAVIIISGNPSIDSAVEAVKTGAFDYLPKPLIPEVLTERVRRAARDVRQKLEAALIRQEMERKKLDSKANIPTAARGRVARLIHESPYAAACGSANGLITDAPPADPQGADNSPSSLAQLEADAIQDALRRFHGNKTRAAECLGINRKTLREKIRKYGICGIP